MPHSHYISQSKEYYSHEQLVLTRPHLGYMLTFENHHVDYFTMSYVHHLNQSSGANVLYCEALCVKGEAR